MKENDNFEKFESMMNNIINREQSFISSVNIRDYFAAKAMQAAIGFYEKNAVLHEIGRGTHHNSVANASYEIADAMLKAREAK